MDKSRKVFVAMMSRDKPEMETSMALLYTMREIEKAGGRMVLKYVVKDSMIPRTRNAFVADFLASDCTDLVMLDDDVVWDRDAVLRLLSHDCDVVGGVYPKRSDPLQYPVRLLDGATLDQVTGLMEVKYLPGGFLRMTRAALEKMIAAFPHLRYRDRDAPGGYAHALFWFDLAPDDEDGEIETWGEDFTFCRRWREIDGKVMCDTLLRFKHIGRKAYEGCYAETFPIAMLFREAG